MNVALLQKHLDIPPVEALQRAFRALPGLVDVDAYTLGRDAYGILVNHLTWDDAQRLQGALEAEGVATEIVPAQELPVLPPIKFIHQAECNAEKLVVYDPLGRALPVAWEHILLVAAGKVRLVEQVEHEYRRRVPTSHIVGQLYRTEMVSEYRPREERNDHLLVELVLTGASLRFQMQADRFNFQYLRERLRGDREVDFRSLVSDITRHAPGAMLNRGAYFVRESAPETFAYPTRNAFQEEMIWLLWRWKCKSTT